MSCPTNVWSEIKKVDQLTKVFLMQTNRKYNLTAEAEEKKVPCENNSW